jgi:hypothetical protein
MYLQAALWHADGTLRAAFLDPLCCHLLLDTDDATYWIPAHLAWQTSEKYFSRNCLVDPNGLNCGVPRVSKTGARRSPLIAALRRQKPLMRLMASLLRQSNRQNKGIKGAGSASSPELPTAGGISISTSCANSLVPRLSIFAIFG